MRSSPGRLSSPARRAGLELLGKVGGHVEAAVTRGFGVRDVGGNRLLTQGRCVEKLPRQLVVVGMEDGSIMPGLLPHGMPPTGRLM